MVNYWEVGPISVSTKKTKQAKKGMGMTGFFDMDVETIGLTLTTKLCKDMPKWVYKD